MESNISFLMQYIFNNNIILYHGLIISGEILIMSVLFHMLYKRRTPTSIIAWLLSMILIPYISIVLYFIFGSRKRKDRYKKANLKLQKRKSNYTKSNPLHEILQSHGIADASKNENFEIYSDPVSAYKIFIDCIEDSKTSIYISTYLFAYDNVTKQIIDSLIKKAKDGVKIKILIDSLGSLKLYLLQYRLKELRDAGAEIRFFMPIFQMPFRNYINLRNHRKIYIFDDKKILSGGMNLSSEYFGPLTNKSRWKDLLFLAEGSSTELFFELFASDWLYASKERLVFTNYKIDNIKGDTFIQVVPSGPDMQNDVLYEALLSAIYSAKKRIWIVTPYFIPNSSLIQSLIIAKHKGIDVKLITPKESNHILTNLTRSSYMRELEDVGIEVALYNEAMLHAKAILFDDSGVMLGSVNLDNRSLFLNYEVATFVYSDKVIKEIVLWIKSLLLSSSNGIKELSVPKRVLENLMRILAPQL